MCSLATPQLFLPYTFFSWLNPLLLLPLSSSKDVTDGGPGLIPPPKHPPLPPSAAGGAI